MKSERSVGKIARKSSADSSRPSSSGGEKGVAIAPPDYGIGFVDRGMEAAAPVQLVGTTETAAAPASAPTPNRTGLPDRLKSGIENLSGYSMDDVRVHYNSSKPAQLNAHAYARGSEIHLGAGQERHLPHEAWHVVQQKQGRVRPTLQMKGGVGVNDEVGLEQEADVMGGRAFQLRSSQKSAFKFPAHNSQPNDKTPAASEDHNSEQLVLQAYRKHTQDEVEYKVSENSLYAVQTKNKTDQLFVKKGNAGPEPADFFQLQDGSTLLNEIDYVSYMMKPTKFTNDCLELAEEMAKAANPRIKERTVMRAKGDYKQVGKKGRVFGHSRETNLEIAQHPRGSFAQGEMANPSVGEAFVTIRKMEASGQTPYHVAMVVAKDGSDTVTSEADAGDEEREVPVFDIYQRPSLIPRWLQILIPGHPIDGDSFHKTYEELYTENDEEPTTGILEPRTPEPNKLKKKRSESSSPRRSRRKSRRKWP